MITSASNEKVKNIKKLIKSSKERRLQKKYVVEGIRMFREIPSDRLEAVFVTEEIYEKHTKIIEEKCKSAKLELEFVKESVFRTMSDTETPQGILAEVDMLTYELEDIIGADNPFVVIIEHLQDPGNLGTIIRTSEGAGATGIILSKDCVDIYNPKVIRSTMGSVFRVPIYVSDDICGDIDLVKSKGITVYGTHLNGKTFYENDYRKPCSFLIGNEGNGLTEEISKKADSLIRIPMMGKVESLNAATSATVVSYEVLRQRML